MWKEYRAFVSRGNVIDLAVGVVIGAAFGKIVTTFVEGIIMPPIGMVVGRIDFSSLFFVLDRSKGIPASLADAKARGIPVITYGQFGNDILSFLIVAAAVFILVKQINRMREDTSAQQAPATKECPYCATNIPLKATRCPQCTSAL